MDGLDSVGQHLQDAANESKLGQRYELSSGSLLPKRKIKEQPRKEAVKNRAVDKTVKEETDQFTRSSGFQKRSANRGTMKNLSSRATREPPPRESSLETVAREPQYEKSDERLSWRRENSRESRQSTAEENGPPQYNTLRAARSPKAYKIKSSKFRKGGKS